MSTSWPHVATVSCPPLSWPGAKATYSTHSLCLMRCLTALWPMSHTMHEQSAEPEHSWVPSAEKLTESTW